MQNFLENKYVEIKLENNWYSYKNDFACYVYRFLSKFVMICLFMDFFNRSNYLWWDMYHWTRDHWYFSTILVLILSYITYKQAKAK